MNHSSRLQNLEIKKPKATTVDAKLKLEQHLQKISDRLPPLTTAEQQASQDWLVNEWPDHLERMRNNAT
ncbi:hypothetical protein SAMN04488523_101416 [Sulfitobacter brevis]|uniref:Uncharacterized protein n=1 Tax=Sulfitobacter brevis TaxID=74348 RepID=A0A1I1TTT0_9RHOB|nr:hypothetical protein [Sulfitobacter brevis]SFD58930.1 hypothetical protein SAMN04488523_101416 [Sulfitobacter brevis]